MVFVALMCCLHNINTMEIACDVLDGNRCIFNQDVTWDGKEEFKITNSDEVTESTTHILFRAPFKTKVIPIAIFDKFPQMYFLHINDVGLETISSDDFVNAKKLTLLDIKKNNIATLKSNSFSTILQQLDLSSNNITKIEDGAFEGPTELNTLFLSGNKVVNLDITKFTKLPKLRILDVSAMDFTFPAPNELAKIVASNSSVTVLHLSNNPIDTPDIWRRLSIFPNLETVYLTGTKITHVDHMDEFKQLLPNLRHIKMQENPLDSKWLEEAKIFFKKEEVEFVECY